MTTRTDGRRPGWLLSHPVAVAAVALLFVNDHVLKAMVPGIVTGKLSDIAGLIVFPLLLADCVSAGMKHLGRPTESPRLVAVASALTVAGFVAVKATAWGPSSWAAAIAGLQWLVGFGWIRGDAVGSVLVVADPSDLIALPAVLVAVLVGRGSPVASGPAGRTVPGGLRQNRSVGVLFALVTALSCIATQPSAVNVSPPTLEEDFDLDHSLFVARHVRWTILDLPKSSPVQRLALTAVFGSTRPAPNDACPASTLPGVDLRIVPDDPSVASPIHGPRGCGELALDLAKVCPPTCAGGATVIVQYTHHPDFAVHQGKLFITLDVRTYTTLDAQIQLARDPRPGEDRDAGAVSTQQLSYPFDVGPADPATQLKATLHVSKQALSGSLDGLHGWIEVYFQSVDVKTGFGSHQWLTVASLDPYEPGSVVGGAFVEVDFLGLCRSDEACEIPLTLDVETPVNRPGEPSFDPGARRDYWRWVLTAHLIALDGREPPAEALTITGPANVIID